MKCHAGVEFPSGKPCPKCNAKLGEVCWPGINADLLELARLRKEIGRLKEIETAARVYYFNYCQDEASEPELCIDPKHHAEAQSLRDALALALHQDKTHD